MLEGLFVIPAATAVAEALASAGVTAAGGPIAVVGNARLAAVLAEGRDVIPVGMPARAAKKLARHLADTSSLEPGSLAAVVGVDVATDAAWADTLRAWVRVVRDGGAIKKHKMDFFVVTFANYRFLIDQLLGVGWVTPHIEAPRCEYLRVP